MGNNISSKKKTSMKWRMLALMLLCWLIPFALMICVMAHYILSNQYAIKAANLTNQLIFNNQNCAEKLNSAIDASRMASYDKTIENAYHLYQTEKNSYYHLGMQGNEYLSKQYRKNPAFLGTILWYYDAPHEMNSSVYNESIGGNYQQILTYWNKDHEVIKNYAKTLHTSTNFYYIDGRLYMVRNIVDLSFQPIAALIMRLNINYCFGSLINFTNDASITICLDNQYIPLLGDVIEKNENISLQNGVSGYYSLDNDLNLYDTKKEDSYILSSIVKLPLSTIFAPIYGFLFVIAGMLLFLIPLLLIYLHIFRSQITHPVQQMMQGASKIESGNLGHQLNFTPNSLEFQFLIDSFNHMSQQLKQQFDHIYEEEIALRDAKIMALQSHINPHFMNNTLEIINWEARLGDNTKVCKMIESLSTLMDAAIDRNKKPEVFLSEEMQYVDAYLYIISERFGKRLSIHKVIDNHAMQCTVPRLILQPVIENAIEHGIVPYGKGSVIIRARLEDNFLRLEIENDGIMTDEDHMKISKLLSSDFDSTKENTNSLGISNVNQRLRILYGPPCGLDIFQKDSNHVIAILTIRKSNDDMQ